MKSLQKVFALQIAEIPRALLLKMITEKLLAEGFANEPGLSESIAHHCLNGGGDTFEWNGPGDHPKKHAVHFSGKDLARLSELAEGFMDRLPAMVEQMSKDAAKILFQSLRRKWPDQAIQEADIVNGFRGRLEKRWGEGFGLLRMLLTTCREIGADTAKTLRKSKARKNLVLRNLVLRLHARACQITAEIITLMENGFADGAMARWRTLYEVGVVTTIIADGGEPLAKSYLEHEIVETKLALDEYTRGHVALGFQPVSERERIKVERAYASAIDVYGSSFGRPYGWAAAHLKKKKVTFRDLEDAARRSEMRSHYKMASYNVHADTAKSIFHRLGVMGDRSTIVAGATNAGFTEPAQNTAITLIQITAVLLSAKKLNFDAMTILRVLVIMRDEIPKSFLRSERRLKRDHADLTRRAN